VALVNGVPKTLTLKDCLSHFLEFREGVVSRRASFLLAKATSRLHLVEGLLSALGQLDAVVQVGCWRAVGARVCVCVCVCVRVRVSVAWAG
jgi:DNA gyrase subunit A